MTSTDAQLQLWLKRDPDSRTRDELLALQKAGNVNELASRFAGRIQFGTAGLRGIVGAGPTRINRLVVQETSAGLASYLLDSVVDAANRGVFVTYDARPDSYRFAQDAASVFLGSGFKVFLTAQAQPTPIGAFGVLFSKAAAGVVITASHNPPEYNGYKVYWENGAQIIPPHDAGIANRIDVAASMEIPWMEITDALESGQICILGKEISEKYCARVREVCSLPETRKARRISVAYTALHGVGASIARTLLQDSGLCEFKSVASQHDPDGTFPTVKFPNPEEPGAMDAVIALARENESTLACANDPDADRLAVAARNKAGDYEMLTGDQVGVLLGSYLLEKDYDKTPIICTSIVSSRMLKAIAEDLGAEYFETLTGFKWLTNVALQHENEEHVFVFAYEEALGYALGQAVRDKDGLSALLAFTQMAEELAAHGKTVIDQLESLYRRHGLYVTAQCSITNKPGTGSITELLRVAAPANIAGRKVLSIMDLQKETHVFADGRIEKLDFFPSDVLVYYLVDESRVIVRPSGTEPKTKCYYEVVNAIPAGREFKVAQHSARQNLHDLVSQHQSSLAVLAASVNVTMSNDVIGNKKKHRNPKTEPG